MSSSAPDPTTAHHDEGFPAQHQDQPGLTDQTRPEPDHGEDSYRGAGRLTGRRALITGGDSGIGRAVAIAFAREGADVALVYMPEEEEDGQDTARLITDAGRRALSLPGDLRDEKFCADIVERTASEFGGIDLLVLNAAYQKDRDGVENLETAELERVFHTNLFAQIFTIRAAVPHLAPGASIILTTSIQAFDPSPGLLDYAMTKAAQVSLVKSLAQELGPKGIRINGVAPGPIWTPLIPATGWDEERLSSFGQDTPLGRAGQPAELAGAYVYLAGGDSSYTSGAIVPVTGGKGL